MNLLQQYLLKDLTGLVADYLMPDKEEIKQIYDDIMADIKETIIDDHVLPEKDKKYISIGMRQYLYFETNPGFFLINNDKISDLLDTVCKDYSRIYGWGCSGKHVRISVATDFTLIEEDELYKLLNLSRRRNEIKFERMEQPMIVLQ